MRFRTRCLVSKSNHRIAENKYGNTTGIHIRLYMKFEIFNSKMCVCA